MELIIAVVVTATISFFVGISVGVKVGVHRVLDTLGVRPGYRISSVSFEKID